MWSWVWYKVFLVKVLVGVVPGFGIRCSWLRCWWVWLILGLARFSRVKRTGLARFSRVKRTGLARCSRVKRTGLARCSRVKRTGLARCCCVRTSLARCSRLRRTGLGWCAFCGSG